MPWHYPSTRYEKYPGADPSTEVRIFWYEWGVCSAVLNYETGEVLEHVDLLTATPPDKADRPPTFGFETRIDS